MLRERFAGRTLLVTGSTGFLAKAFVAKVVRDLPEVRRVLLLIRSRRRAGRPPLTAAERMTREVVESSAFRRLRGDLGEEADARIARMLVAVEGDLTREGLGLSDAGRELALSADAFVNSAATVVFDERLDEALAINADGPRHLLEAARRAHAAPLLHVSTAYVCGRREGIIREDAPAETRAAIDDILGRSEGTFELERERAALEARVAAVLAATKASGENPAEQLVDAGMAYARERGWNDTYTYTKSIGERYLLRDRGQVPVAILRPSIIESALAEPEPGWIDGLRMGDPLFAAYGKGLLRSFAADPDSPVDFIPVDHVVNAMLAALGRLLTPEGAQEARTSPPVYQVATSTANGLGFRQLFELTRAHFLDNPMTGKDGKAIPAPPWTFPTEAAFVASLERKLRLLGAAQRVLGVVPGSAGIRSRQGVARLAAQGERLRYYTRIYAPYCNFRARFDTARTEALFASLPDGDRKSFDFDPRGFDWDTYIQDVHLPGLRRNVLRETVRGRAEAAPSAAPLAAETADAAPGRTLLDLLDASVAAGPDRLALQVKRDGSWLRWTYRDLAEASLGAAARLQDAGARAGDRIVLVAENGPEWVATYFGILAAGATAVPLDAQSEAARIEAVARITEARFVVLSQRCASALSGPTGFERRTLEDLQGTRLTADQAAARGLPARVSTEAPASLLFTSGTTLEPKGVVLPHRAFLANVESVLQVLAPRPEDRLVSVLPLHHAFEFTGGLLTPLAAGASVTYLDTVSAQALVETLREVEATCLVGVPRLYELMLAGIERQLAELRGGAATALGALRGTSRAMNALGLSSASRALLAPIHSRFGGRMRLFVSGGAALDPRVHDEFRALGFTLVEGYGLTETSPVLTVSPPSDPRAGSVGRAVPGVEVRIHRPGPDGVGEIVARGANVMAGYWRNPEATARVMVAGWFHTGDLGRIDDDGYVRVTGRLKDLIVTGAGKNVYPDEVEAHLKDLPGVREICVVGVRSRAGAGEEVHLVAVLGEDDSEAARERVRAEVASRLASLPAWSRVSRIHFRTEELPKTRLMKVKRGAVQQVLEGVDAAVTGVGEAAADPDPAVRDVLALLARLARVPAASLRRDQNLVFDLGVDSLMRVELVAAIEGRAGRKVPDEAAKDLATVRDLAELARAWCAPAARAAGTGVNESAGATALRPSADRAPLFSRAAAPLVRLAWPAFYGGYLRLRVVGRENLPAGGAYIVAANHQSHLDAGAILTALGAESRRLHVVAARDYFFDTPWKGAFFSELLNAIAFDRQGDFEPGLAACRMALASGDPLLIFPEGTRSPDGRLQQFKAGLGVLAVELGVPVVPTRVDGTHAALPKGARLPKPIPVTVTFGEPVLPAALLGDPGLLPYERYRLVTDAVRDGIAALAAAPASGRRAAGSA